MKLTRPVFVIGFMGAGKTSVARKVARRAGVASIDADAYLERSLGKSITDVFAEDGEEAFRAWEAETLADLAAREPMLIACGGGVITTEPARAVLRDGGYVVYLKVAPDEAARRIEDASTRPLFQDADAVARLWARRLPLYEEVADLAVDTADKNLGQLAGEVMDGLAAAGVLVADVAPTPLAQTS